MAMGCVPIVHGSGGAMEFVPEDFRYKNLHEAAQKITKEVYEWSPRKALEVIRIAEKFREENFSKEFLKHFELYERNMFYV
jgi:hypothetical protein